MNVDDRELQPQPMAYPEDGDGPGQDTATEKPIRTVMGPPSEMERSTPHAVPSSLVEVGSHLAVSRETSTSRVGVLPDLPASVVARLTGPGGDAFAERLLREVMEEGEERAKRRSFRGKVLAAAEARLDVIQQVIDNPTVDPKQRDRLSLALIKLAASMSGESGEVQGEVAVAGLAFRVRTSQ